MARLKSLLKVEGTLDGITFYKTQDGHLVRLKGGADVNKIKHDPRFARTRENMQEFTLAAKVAKMFRRSVRPLIFGVSDNRVSSRLTQVMSKIAKHDQDNFRGMRTAASGLGTTEGKDWLKSFNFNRDSNLESILSVPWTIDTSTGVITLSDLIPSEDLSIPEGSTHFSISGAMQIIDFTTGISDLKFTNVVNSTVIPTVLPVVLAPASLPTGTGITLFYLKIEFFQLVNTIQYPLKNGSHNALSIIEVI